MDDRPPIIDYARPRPTPPPLPSSAFKPNDPQSIRPPGPVFGIMLLILFAAIISIGIVLIFAFG